MEKFLLELIFCSAVMSVVSFIYIGVSRVLMNVWSAKTRSFLWIIILIGFITPFKPSLAEPVYSVTLSEQMAAAPVSAVTESYPQSPVVQSPGINVHLIFSALWLSGILFFFVKNLLKQRSFIRYVKRYALPASKEVINIALEAARDLNIKKDFSVAVLPGAVTPMMTGFKSPVVILPHKSYTASQLRLIIKHELCHYKRHDLVYKLFIIACRTIHWFNPFMGLLVRYIEQECELACDETVMKNESLENRKIYCNSVLDTVRAQNTAVKGLMPVVSSNFGDGRCSLKNRLKMIISEKRKKKLCIVSAAVVMLTAFSGTVFAVTTETEYTDGTVYYETTTFAVNDGGQNGELETTKLYNASDEQIKTEPSANGINAYEFTTTAVYETTTKALESTTASAYGSNTATSQAYVPAELQNENNYSYTTTAVYTTVVNTTDSNIE